MKKKGIRKNQGEGKWSIPEKLYSCKYSLPLQKLIRCMLLRMV